jgi:hypothetical protein
MSEGATAFLGYLSHESKDDFDLKSKPISAKINKGSLSKLSKTLSIDNRLSAVCFTIYPFHFINKEVYSNG